MSFSKFKLIIIVRKISHQLFLKFQVHHRSVFSPFKDDRWISGETHVKIQFHSKFENALVLEFVDEFNKSSERNVGILVGQVEKFFLVAHKNSLWLKIFKMMSRADTITWKMFFSRLSFSPPARF